MKVHVVKIAAELPHKLTKFLLNIGNIKMQMYLLLPKEEKEECPINVNPVCPVLLNCFSVTMVMNSFQIIGCYHHIFIKFCDCIFCGTNKTSEYHSPFSFFKP